MADITTFGHSASGEAVQKITLRGGDLQVGLLTYGAVLQSLRLEGVAHDLTLGSARVEDYEGAMRYHGSLIAPVVNRIRGAKADIAGQPFGFEANQDGKHCLHSGNSASQTQNWHLTEASDDSATLTLHMPDGLGGFPGNRRISARFSLAAPATLRLDLTASTDAPTLFNAANHSYWNLDGTPDFAGHTLQIAAERWLPTDAANLPTGTISACAGSTHDFRTPRRLAPQSPPLDNCFCLADAPRALTPALTLTGASGLSMCVATTEPGVQVYDARDARRPGGPAYEGLAIETQFWPDAPNHPGFPSILLMPGTPRLQTTEWHFARR